MGESETFAKIKVIGDENKYKFTSLQRQLENGGMKSIEILCWSFDNDVLLKLRSGDLKKLVETAYTNKPISYMPMLDHQFTT